MDVVSVRRMRIGEAMRNCLLDSSALEVTGQEVKEDTTEFQRYCYVGKMDMLFSLVANNILGIEKAAEIANMSLEEAEDMLQGWKEAQNIE